MATTQEKEQRRLSVNLIAGDIDSELCEALVPYEDKFRSVTALKNLKHNGAVLQAHIAYLKAGASWIITSNHEIVEGNGYKEGEARNLTSLAGLLANLARQMADQQVPARIIGRLPPPPPNCNHNATNRGIRQYSVICNALKTYVDAFIAEGMSSVEEAIKVYNAAKNVVESTKPIIISFCVNKVGDQLSQVITKMLEKLEENEEFRIEAITFSCIPANLLSELSDLMDQLNKGKVRIGAIAGKSCSTCMNVSTTPSKEELSQFFEECVSRGATIVGCCGVPPSYYRYARREMGEKYDVAP